MNHRTNRRAKTVILFSHYVVSINHTKIQNKKNIIIAFFAYGGAGAERRKHGPKSHIETVRNKIS